MTLKDIGEIIFMGIAGYLLYISNVGQEFIFEALPALKGHILNFIGV